MFLLKVEMKNNKNFPRLSAIEDILDTAFEFMIENLRKYYNGNDTNLIYMTITQPNFRSLRSGAYVLQTENKEFLNYVANMFHEFLNSNEDIELTKGFQVYFKVLSMSHVKYPRNRRKPKKLGSKKTSDEKQIGSGLLEIPNGYPGFPMAFLNKCLLTSFIFGYYQALDDQTTYSELKLLFNRQNNNKKIGGDKLKQKLQELQDKIGLPVCGPYNMDIVLPKLAAEYNCQIHVINSLDRNAMIDSFPPSWNEGLPQIFLYLVSSNHVVLVEKQKTFCRANRQFCVACKKTFSYTYRHKCKERQSCNKCRSIITKTMDCYNYKNTMPFQFCDSNIGKKLLEIQNCPKCDQPFDTEQCFVNHKQICGKQIGCIGFFCKNCQKFIQCPNSNLIKEIKQKHSCDEPVKCSSCKMPKTANHLCKLKKVQDTKNAPNLVFFYFQFQDISTANCKSCYLLKEQFRKDHNLTWKELLVHSEIAKLACDIHLNNEANFVPNVLVLYHEKLRGSFTRHILTDDNLSNTTDTKEKYFESNYFCESMQSSKERLSQFNKQPKCTDIQKKKIQNLELKQNKTVLEKFWLLITQEDFRNSTFLSVNETTPNMVRINIVRVAFCQKKDN
jgi:hypothetical protein